MGEPLLVAIVISIAVLILGAVAIWRLRSHPATTTYDARGHGEMGYGRNGWERELALWEGVLRRLQVQAARHAEPPPRLQREIEQAEARIARAREALDRDQ